VFDFLSEKFSGVLNWLTKKSKLSEKNISDALSQVKEALLQADVPLGVINDFLSQISQEFVGQKVHEKLNPGDQFIKIVNDKLVDFLGGESRQETISFQYPSTVMVMGLQGSGKTTTVAKIANWVQKETSKRGKQRRILVASVDFYRPAAIEQLKVLADQVGINFYKSPESKPIQAAQDILDHFKKNRYELLLLDTAGRLHIDQAMMKELQEIRKIINPKHSFLVLDAMTGQESLNVAKEFNQAAGFDTAILSKMDSDARGGAAFAFCYTLKKPIYFVGTGEKIDDFESFIPKRIASRILGMGDIMSLIERANEKVDQQKQESIAKRMMSGQFTLKDFADQMGMMGKVGSLQKIMKYMPGMNAPSQEQIEQGEREMRQFKAIISSMTPKERLLPQILGASRKKRIAHGSGTKVQNINQLLQKFEQSRQFVRMFKKMGKFPSFFK